MRETFGSGSLSFVEASVEGNEGRERHHGMRPNEPTGWNQGILKFVCAYDLVQSAGRNLATLTQSSEL